MQIWGTAGIRFIEENERRQNDDRFRNDGLWMAIGSQHLYGDQRLKTVAVHANGIADELTNNKRMAVKVIPKAMLTTPDAVTQLCTEANASNRCTGIIAWMHTFAPAKIWLGGLRLLAKPMLHLHTKGRGRSLAGRTCACTHRGMGTRGGSLARLAAPEDRSVRR